MPSQDLPRDAPRTPAEPRTGSALLKGERRVVTVLFADVVNSTGMAEALDPEDWTEIMNGGFEQMTAPIHRYEGTVGRLMGDGLLAFFGAPSSHEDDPQRAVLAALDMIEAIRGYGRQVRLQHGLDFEVRIGINTGPVVVADVGSLAINEHTAMGDAVNVAARMQSAADPGTIQISAETNRLVSPVFSTKALGAIALKGKTEPVPAFRVIGLSAQPTSLRALGSARAPLIGRGAELDRLKEAVDQVRQGRGQVVCLIGEAGLGKSRLVSELHHYWTESAPVGRWELMYGIPYDASRPFGLFQNFARGIFSIELDDAAEVIHDKVRRTLTEMGAPAESIALCSVAMERVIASKVLHEGAADYSAEALKADLYETILPAFRASYEDGPGVVVVDDLQWADQASVDLLIHLMQLADQLPVLFLFAFRPERQSAAWQVKIRAETEYAHRYSEITLSSLDATDTDSLVSALLNIEALPDDIRRLILRKTDGNPYFIEEVVRALVEQGAVTRTEGRLAWSMGAEVADIAIPDSLQALLMARMDRLDEATRSTLQMASVIGRSFYYRILLAISESAIKVDDHLRALERVELLREAGRLPELEYIFKHELARDAAYATILNRRRREFHLRVGEAMEALFVGRLEEHAHRLAQHFERAGDDIRAARYFEMAGDAAAALDARSEAEGHYGNAMAAALRGPADATVVAKLRTKALPSRIASPH